MITEKGNHEPNEDAVGMAEQNGRYCFLLADGLGGHGKGEVASNLAVSETAELFMQNETEETFIEHAFEHAQSKILEYQKQVLQQDGMKTTMTILVIDNERCKWGHIGDSRIYYFYRNKIRKRTLDHSVPQMLVKSGKIKESEIRNHPDRNRLLRVMGESGENIQYEIEKEIKRKKKQAFLLCSDGFWELITETEMEETLRKSNSVEQWMDEMQSIVCKNGENKDMDNYSAIAVWLE